MDEESATTIVKNYEVKVPSLLVMKAKTLVETNPIADWLDTFVVYEGDARTNIGVAKRDKDSNSATWYLDTEKWLYPNYCEYCHNSGTKAVSLRRFVTLLSDLTKNQLGLDIKRERDREGSYFVGLKLRSENDDSPPMITGNSEVVVNPKPELNSTNVVHKLWTVVIAKVSNAINYVIDGTVDAEEIVEDNTESKQQHEELKKPSVPIPTEERADTEPDKDIEPINGDLCSEKTENLESRTIAIGDRVMIEDCPGHWSWASPFTIEAIQGEMAKLEMVGELVEIKRLSLING